MSTCPYHVVAEGEEGGEFETHWVTFTLACFESMEDAQREVRRLSGRNLKHIRNIRVEVVK